MQTMNDCIIIAYSTTCSTHPKVYPDSGVHMTVLLEHAVCRVQELKCFCFVHEKDSTDVCMFLYVMRVSKTISIRFVHEKE